MSTEAVRSLSDVFCGIPDPRDRRGKIYPLASVLTLIATAMLCGCRSLEAIAQWGRDYNDLVPLLGFSRRTRDGQRYRTPCTSGLHTTLAALGAAVFEAALTRWILAQGVADLAERIMAIDGKSLRGSQGHQLPGVHLLAAYSLDLDAVVAQLRVPGKTNEHKAALELLKVVPLEGTLFTGDAAFTQRDFCAAVVQGGGDYFLTVKENQPTLEADIRAAFGPAFSPSGAATSGRGGRPRRGPRQGARPAGDPPAPGDHPVAGVPGLARRQAGLPHRAGAPGPRQAERRDGLCDHQLGTGAGLGEAVAGDCARALED
jgi:DDE_Tnp_1-associated/Transposase DDE domain